MASMEKLLQDLHSENQSKRYAACVEPRDASSILDEAISALRDLTNDPNEDVADAALRALNAHNTQISLTNFASKNETNEFVQKKRVGRGEMIIISAVSAFISSSFFQSISNGYAEASRRVPIAPLALPFIAIGASLLAVLVAYATLISLRDNLRPIYVQGLSSAIGLLIGFLSSFIWR